MHPGQTELRQIEALLDFYLASGVDASIGNDPVDWYELTATHAELARQSRAAVQASAAPAYAAPQMQTPAAAGRPPVTEAGRPAAQAGAQAAPQAVARAVGGPIDHAAIPDQVAIEAARELAAAASTLDALKACLENFEGCNLKRTAKTLVFSDGNPKARVMLIGEAPGRDEDLQGKPFVGRSGQLLDRMLAAISLDRSSVYFANTVPWRPPGNRTPTPQETEICRPFIQRQIELVNPEVLVFLGAASATTLLGVQDGIRKMRGRWMTYSVNGREVAAMATYHPDHLLRSPLEKRLSWRDFLNLRYKVAEIQRASPEDALPNVN